MGASIFWGRHQAGPSISRLKVPAYRSVGAGREIVSGDAIACEPCGRYSIGEKRGEDGFARHSPFNSDPALRDFR
ncbi:MAG: hypothetical protein FalmKO_00930 [Falsiruegeria mediterranea]